MPPYEPDTDGTPRVVPTWFHWTGEEIVMATYADVVGVVPEYALSAYRYLGDEAGPKVGRPSWTLRPVSRS